jgi:hypothetical protein
MSPPHLEAIAYPPTRLLLDAYDPPAVIIIGGMFKLRTVDADQAMLLTRTVSMTLCKCISGHLYDTLLISLTFVQGTVSEIVL